MNFRSDNTAGASDKVLQALIATNGGTQVSYGADEVTLRVEEKLKEIFEHDLSMCLVATGTAANSLGLSCVTPPWGAVLCHIEAHICEDECGAPEFFSGGAKMVGLPGIGGKLKPSVVKYQLDKMPAEAISIALPAAMSLTQATEVGTVYTLPEIAALADVAKSRELAVHMDGARFANALVTLGCTPAEMTWKQGVDLISFGGTKNGCVAVEAVIFFDKAKGAEMIRRRKRSGHTLSKGRFLGAQMEAYLADDHWLDLAKRANKAAEHLESTLRAMPGVRIGWPRQANQVFAILPDTVDRQLKAAGAVYHSWSPDWLEPAAMPKAGETLYRFVTSFRTSADEIGALAHAVAAEPVRRSAAAR